MQATAYMKSWEKGQVICGLNVRDSVVYVETSAGYWIPCGMLDKADYSWGEDQDVPDMTGTTLAVLDYVNTAGEKHSLPQGMIRFGFKQLTDKAAWFRSVIHEANEDVIFEIADAWLESKRTTKEFTRRNIYDFDNH